MNRRAALLTLSAAAMGGCAGAGVSSAYLREELGAEIAGVLINAERLRPWIAPFRSGAQLAAQALALLAGADLAPAFDQAFNTFVERRIEATRAVAAQRFAQDFEVADLIELRRLYSSRLGQKLAALALSRTGGTEPPALTAAEAEAIRAFAASDLGRRSAQTLSAILTEAFRVDLAFDSEARDAVFDATRRALRERGHTL